MFLLVLFRQLTLGTFDSVVQIYAEISSRFPERKVGDGSSGERRHIKRNSQRLQDHLVPAANKRRRIRSSLKSKRELIFKNNLNLNTTLLRSIVVNSNIITSKTFDNSINNKNIINSNEAIIERPLRANYSEMSSEFLSCNSDCSSSDSTQVTLSWQGPARPTSKVLYYHLTIVAKVSAWHGY